jgi:hypothetical protein
MARSPTIVFNSKCVGSGKCQRSDKLALVDGDVGLASAAGMIVATAVNRFGSCRNGGER